MFLGSERASLLWAGVRLPLWSEPCSGLFGLSIQTLLSSGTLVPLLSGFASLKAVSGVLSCRHTPHLCTCCSRGLECPPPPNLSPHAAASGEPSCSTPTPFCAAPTPVHRLWVVAMMARPGGLAPGPVLLDRILWGGAEGSLTPAELVHCRGLQYACPGRGCV